MCTWNRAGLLRQTLDRMTQLVNPAGLEWELVVVNNNCTDSTDQVLASFKTRLPVRRLVEPRPGLSNARNRAIDEARGRFIIWTDDDVLVDPRWLAAYCEAFERYPTANVFGGRIAPWFAVPPPRWLKQAWPRVAYAFAALDLGETEIPLSVTQVPFGANFATRTEDVRKARFNPALGVRPGSRMGGEDTDLVRRLLNGGSGWWVPGAKVRHWIPAERQTLRYLYRWHAAYGRYLGEHTTVPLGPRFLGRPRWLWRHCASVWMAFVIHRPFRPAPVWVEDFVKGSIAWGQLRAGAPALPGAPQQTDGGSR